VLDTQPSMLNRVFEKVFGSFRRLNKATTATDPRSKWALRHFWHGAPAWGGGGDLGGGRSEEPTPAASRYLSDFDEKRKLGQGGFGQVRV
jgi:hypothetical protein